MAVLERHFSFAPLKEASTAKLAAELEEVGSTLAQGIGLRNNLYREKQAAGRVASANSTREALPASWEALPESSLEVPPVNHCCSD